MVDIPSPMLHRLLPTLLAAAFAGCAATPGPRGANLPSVGPGGEGLAAHITAATQAIVPDSGGENEIFSHYQGATGKATFARNWTRDLDLTGVSWDRPPANVTLISPRHVVMASHSARAPNTLIAFHTRQGNLVPNSIVERVRLPGKGHMPDITVGLLRDPVKGLPFYKVLPPGIDYAKHLPGAPVLVTDKGRRIHVHQVRAVGGRRIAFQFHPEFPESLAKTLIGGDSGHPAFVLVHGKPVLVSTHTFGGAGTGPFFSDPENFAAVNQAMQELGGGYQLSTARF